ncbi:MAG: lipoyl(octanoyl) transferase LipB [Candidatus Hydrogenedentes bacterium]|nr:lipoyl(octanoyl) transferase LipB [Candidatus Hydrogenedentota bacterium]
MMHHEIQTLRLDGLISYAHGLDLQKARSKAVEAGEAGNALFLLEHEPVLTMGRNFQSGNLLVSPEALAARGIALEKVDRGGDVTYHGPGQLVAYPVLDLKQWKLSIRWYLRSLEQVLINQLAGYGLHAGREEGRTGVWVGGAKVAAIGVGIHNWVTYHGIALNVDPIMEHFGFIVPCGIGDKPVTTLRQLLGAAPPMQQVMDDFEAAFREYFVDWQDETPPIPAG